MRYQWHQANCYIHTNLNETFTSKQDVPFGGKSVFVFGDFYHLPPVRAKPVFMFNETETTEGFKSKDLWRKFKLVEIDQIMRQKDNKTFIGLLNRVRIGKIDENTKIFLKSRLIQKHS